MDFKNSDALMASWSIYEFSAFLYHAFGRPAATSTAPKELEAYIEDIDQYPKISEVRPEFIEFKIDENNVPPESWHPKNNRPPVDFEREAKIHKKLGNQGEQIVLRLEREHLRAIGRKDLAENVRWASQDSDMFGYDIVSFDDGGRDKLIEVKSTTRPPQGVTSFIISSNQYHQAKRLENYYLYVVFEAKTTHPKVWSLKRPLDHENKGLTLEPLSFRVTINTEPEGI